MQKENSLHKGKSSRKNEEMGGITWTSIEHLVDYTSAIMTEGNFRVLLTSLLPTIPYFAQRNLFIY